MCLGGSSAPTHTTRTERSTAQNYHDTAEYFSDYWVPWPYGVCNTSESYEQRKRIPNVTHQSTQDFVNLACSRAQTRCCIGSCEFVRVTQYIVSTAIGIFRTLRSSAGYLTESSHIECDCKINNCRWLITSITVLKQSYSQLLSTHSRSLCCPQLA